MSQFKRTSLHAAHQKLCARFVDFAGWEMPLYYSGIVDEHRAVRRAGGIFDISHMGQILAAGPGAAAFLNQVLTNDIRRLAVGQAQYTLLCNERGGVVDDLYAYRLEDQKYLLILNASRAEADWDWLQAQYDQSKSTSGLQLKDVSGEQGAVAVQGPCAGSVLDQTMPRGSLGGKLVDRITALAKNEVGIFLFRGTAIYVARTGYTGEDGFEVVAPAESLLEIWNVLLQTGRALFLQPAGLGARDTLRTEMCYPLFGQELTEEITPLEAGLGRFVALDKGDFVGRPVLQEQKTRGVPKQCVAFIMSEKSAPPRPHYGIWRTGAEAARIGEVSSGTQSPSLGVGIGLGFVPPNLAKPGTRLEIEIRGKRIPAEVVRKPIYRKEPSA